MRIFYPKRSVQTEVYYKFHLKYAILVNKISEQPINNPIEKSVSIHSLNYDGYELKAESNILMFVKKAFHLEFLTLKSFS